MAGPWPLPPIKKNVFSALGGRGQEKPTDVDRNCAPKITETEKTKISSPPLYFMLINRL